MIRQIQLDNFRGFEKHVADFGEVSVVIGRNNAGKSSLIEAIRIIATVMKQLTTGRFQDAPGWVLDPWKGMSSSLAEVERKSDAFFYRYGEPPATITALTSNGSQIVVSIGPERQVHCHAFDSSGKAVTSRSAAKKAAFPTVSILPQIGPLRDKETVLQKPYVQKCIDTHLASRHFRNQIRYMQEHFEKFSKLFNSTWPDIAVHSFESKDARNEDPLFLMLREQNFVAEAADFGHGVQMWLQIIWFLSRADPQTVVVLDEPDVYLHPDQQSSLMQLVRGRFEQSILSTHANAIITECDNREILRLDRKLSLSAVGTTEQEHEHMLKTLNEESVDSVLSNEPIKHEICLVCYEEATAAVKTSDGATLLAVQPDVAGAKQLLSTTTQVLTVRLDMPNDVDIYVNGAMVDLSEFENHDSAELHIDLNEYA
ncbi:MAG: AAA family ATPase [Planctomycetaceae bacterium]|nr:AAA family ATPase [Planctomycetaceae bacterium]